MTHRYDIPRVTTRRRPAIALVAVLLVVLGVLLVRHVWEIATWHRDLDLTILWGVFFATTAAQWVMSWLERPYTVDAAGQAHLDRLRVTVTIPVYNEDPQVLDRVLYSVFQQTRRPDRVEVVDDGSAVDYREVREWWLEHHPRLVAFSWVRQSNQGKKQAQAHTFTGDPADVFVTLDSDTTLEERAIEEGLKPFCDQRVQSVAGFELAWNHDWNLLTRVNSTRQLIWQLVTCSAQSVAGGNVLINRGTFALYRGDLVREVLPAYVGETFWGRRVKLGDDTFLTTLALCRGRAVQQPSAVCLAMYPDNLSHHLRQWTRWMRGTTLRTFWRLRYLRPHSWGWLYTVLSLWWYLAALAITAVLVVRWPASANYADATLAAGTIWAWVQASRLLTVRRSDQGRLGRLGAVVLAPASALWVLAVLRLVRVYGTLTFLRQGWATRARVEVGAELDLTGRIAPRRPMLPVPTPTPTPTPSPVTSLGSVSVVVPVYNEGGSVRELVERLDRSLHSRPYEVIFVDDHSADDTVPQLERLTDRYPLTVVAKRGARGKAFSLIEGISRARHDCVAVIDGDLQYPPEAIRPMLAELETKELDVVVARRRRRDSLARKVVSGGYLLLRRTLVRRLAVDVQSGLKVFRRRVFTTMSLRPTPWTFDFEFLLKSTRAGYRIGSYDVDFQQRASGRSKVRIIPATIEIATNLLLTLVRTPTLVTFSDGDQLSRGAGCFYRGRSYVTHTPLDMARSAIRRLTVSQVGLLLAVAAALLAGLLVDSHRLLVVLVAALTTLYFGDSLFGLLLICRSYVADPTARIPDVSTPPAREWPTYTILCPLYRESAVLPQFVAAVERLDYPKDRLEVLLLLEQDDAETQAAARRMDLPDCFRICVVPGSMPRTKPKACNYGLRLARGQYVVVYDAEDVPDPEQLKKAVLAFHRGGPTLGCVQAKLNYYNWNQNLLTRLFTLEYSLWFDLILPGLQSLGAPIPLGGTSNHFRLSDLRQLGGWDPFNVTEDADLGMRLFKLGFTTMMVDSTTLEEANSHYWNWVRQRSRWLKGYIQTYFVHSRRCNAISPPRHFAIFQLTIGGKVLAALLNPLMWVLTAAYVLDRARIGPFVQSLFPRPVFYMGLVALVLGNFLYLYSYMLGAAKRKQYGLIVTAFLAPLYWVMISAAAYKAVVEFAVRPFHWQKTRHGLHLEELRR